MAKARQYQKRLQEITDKLGDLSDDDVLHLLAERKQLEELRQQYEAVEKTQAQLAKTQEERTRIGKELDRLNTLISPDKQDDELIHLVEERKVLEGKLEAVQAEIAHLEQGGAVPETEEAVSAEATKEASVPASTPEEAKEPLEKEVIAAPIPEEAVPQAVVEEPAVPQPEKILHGSADDAFGREAIAADVLEPGSDFARALDRIKNDPETIGKILEDLPASMRRNKTFMLAVAEIDPAYAIHYADKETLKKEEDFNLKVIKLHNEHRPGSVLAEMLPEARTAKIVAAAVKLDYRNIRFVQPQMEGYDTMMESAKKGALEKVKEMKNGVDIAFLIPKILQKDSAFMKQVAALAPEE